ncbi:MAG: flagellin [Acidocella sp.]|uniref:flagellin N-terminal helical domain-containing protein n=1 Tax=Acidocella sp. TaxID=50710 RepID=UPI003FC83442
MSAVGSILTNTGALQALNSIANTSMTNNNLESQLSSGLSINSPSDNPAGYITAQGFTSQLNGLTQAISNANQGVSLLQTAQGAIGQQVSVVQQLNSIAVQAANGTQTSAESQSLQNLASQLTGQVSTIASQTQFNNINLLDGSFTGKQFQVGANEGQTLNLSIGNTSANSIGMYATGADTANVYKTGASSASGVVSAAGVFGAGKEKITGPTGGSGSFTVAAKESAAALATAANGISGQTGVQAQATNTATFSVAAGTTDHKIAFTLQAGNGSGGASSAIGTAVSVDASSLAEAVSQINQQSSTSGIVASDSSGKLTLTQTAGQNIAFTAVGTAASGGTLKTTAAAPHTVAANDIQQGQVQLQSSAAFSAVGSATATLGQSAASLNSLASINVSTTAGANKAINVVKYALAALNNQGGQLGAVQQSLTANINNMNTTSQNLTTALGVVQDANIPQVSTQLTQSQIQAQSGVAALKSSTQLQQSYLSLLP